MSEFTDLKNHFLIAAPMLTDQNFAGAVLYLFDQTEDGAMGIVINRAAGTSLNELLERFDIQHRRQSDVDILVGGPVLPNRGFVLHTAFEQVGGMPIADDLHWSTSIDLLTEIAKGEGPAQFLIALGYASWAPGQLEAEIYEGAWLVCPANNEILFQMPVDQRFSAATKELEFDYGLLSTKVGCA